MIHLLLPFASILAIAGVMLLFELRLNIQRKRRRDDFRNRMATYYRNRGR
jgi:Flp pilus assembly protein TadB